MRLPRMTTRQWMMVVAEVGLLMGGLVGGLRLMRSHEILLLHYRHHMRVLDWCAVQESAVRDSSRIYDTITDLLEGRRGELDMQLGLVTRTSRPLVDADRPTVARLHRITVYHAAMARKYRWAANYPWLTVETDPPKPR
jgi:hypothetical protein